MAAVLLLATVLASQAVLRVQGSGYLQVGFFLYEFRHDPSTLPADITGLPLPSAPTVTSPPPDHDVIGDVTPWKVRTLLPKQKAGGRGRGGVEGGSRNGRRRTKGGGEVAAASSSIWSETSPCNETSSPRPQYRFLLCLDYLYSQPSEAPCRLGKVELSTLSHLGALGRDLLTFPSALGVTSNGSVTSNPIVFGFDSWKGAVRLKVYVRCCGVAAERRAHCEETFSYSIHQKPASFALSLSPENVMLSGRGRLVLSLMLQCDEDFHGDQCQAYCRITAPDTGHAFCNRTSGKKQCMSGWEGPDCQTDVDECRHHYCENGAHCVNSPPGSFTCQCPLGFVGRRCQRRAPVCHTIPCKNSGSCHDTPFGFVCFCPYGYAGYRCERQLRVIRDNSSDSLNVGKTTGSDDRYFAMSWESWYSALLIGGFFFIALVIVVCCLLRGRLFRCGITANGSFYSLFISTKTNDDGDLPPDQRRDSVVTDGSLDNMHTYQNIFSVDRKHSYPSMTSHRRSQGEPPRPTSSEELSVRYLSQLPKCGLGFQDMCHYVNVGACPPADGQADLEGLPNLVDPRKSPLLIHRDLSSQATLAERKSVPNKRPSPIPIRRPLSEKAEIPKVMVTQHFKPPPSTSCQFDSTKSLSSNSPESVRGESRVKPSSSRKSLIRSRARDVYTIGGSLSVEELTGPGSPKPAVRKALLGAIPGRKKGSQPRLCSIRRMDSGGYEIPLKYQNTNSLRNQYASLRNSRMDEHVYNELHCQTPDMGTMGRRRLGEGHVPQHAPRGKPRKRSPFLTVDQRTSLFSETACYMDLTEHVPESGLQEVQESVCRTSEASSEVSSTGTRRKVRADRTRIRTVQRLRKTRRQPSQRPLTQDTAWREIRMAGTNNLAFEEEGEGGGASIQAMTTGDEEDSDDVDYEELFNADTDDNDDMYSDCDYTDVFTKTNAAV